MQSAIFGVMIASGHVIFMIGVFFLKENFGNHVMRDKFLHYKLMGDVVYSM
jgi:hypothetical protein